jgi:tRNA (guanine37-N1)-methyltransferase
MEYLVVETKEAEHTKARLMRLGLFNRQSRVVHSASYVYFPIEDISVARIKKLFRGLKVVRRTEKDRSGHTPTYRERMESLLTKKEFADAIKGYDLLGNIAIIDVREHLRKKEKKIAEFVLQTNKQVSTVVAKVGAVGGRYRLRRFRYIAGVRTFVSRYSENGCRFEFDIRKTFFSNRLSFERARIAKQVKSQDNVMVMFAGVGPFAIEIAKAHATANVIAIELNKDAFLSMKDNIMLNKTINVKPILGDVKAEAKKYSNTMDRVIMPLPKDSPKFLNSAFQVSRNKAVLHFYYFGDMKTAFADAIKLVKKSALDNGRSATVISKRVVRPYSPSEIEVVVDFRLGSQARKS